MAKWEYWFWVTIVIHACTIDTHLAEELHQQPAVDLIDILTAPTLKTTTTTTATIPTETTTTFVRSNEKVTIITPSSVVVMSSSRPSTTIRPKLRDVSVSHSVSVVSVQYSSSVDDEHDSYNATSEEAAVVNQTSSERKQPFADEAQRDEFTGPTSAPIRAEEENRAPKSVDVMEQPQVEATTSSTSIPVVSSTRLNSAWVKYEHMASPEDEANPRPVDGPDEADEAGYRGITSETAKALGELGFEYKEYMDDSSLLGDDSNDEVIPAFNEEAYEQPRMQEDNERDEADYSVAARAAEPGSTADELAASRHQQGKKAPLPNQYEPSTIIGITIGAFLLIFIGTAGLAAFIYHERYANKPHSLDDRYANSDSGGCSTSVDDSIGRVSHIECSGFDIPKDTYCEEMYNLDNDSFLNSLETVAMPTMLWSLSPNSDSDV